MTVHLETTPCFVSLPLEISAQPAACAVSSRSRAIDAARDRSRLNVICRVMAALAAAIPRAPTEKSRIATITSISVNPCRDFDMARILKWNVITAIIAALHVLTKKGGHYWPPFHFLREAKIRCR